MRKTIVNAVNKLPANDPLRRVKMAVNLILVVGRLSGAEVRRAMRLRVPALPSAYAPPAAPGLGGERPARRDRPQPGARAGRAGLQGAGVRLPAGRQRRREHAVRYDAAGYQNYASDPPARVRHQHCRRRSCCRSSRQRSRRRSDSIRRAAPLKTLFDQKQARGGRQRRHARATVDHGRASRAGARRARPISSRTPTRSWRCRAATTRASRAPAGAAGSPTGSTPPTPARCSRR